MHPLTVGVFLTALGSSLLTTALTPNGYSLGGRLAQSVVGFTILMLGIAELKSKVPV